MTQLSDTFLRCLNEADFAGLRRAWSHFFPRMPRPATDDQARFVLHRARTTARSVPLHKRLYSHEWLEDRGLPSDLPAELRRDRPATRIVPAVGVAVRARHPSPDARARAKEIEAAMARAGGDALAAGVTDPREISRAMWAARDRLCKIG